MTTVEILIAARALLEGAAFLLSVGTPAWKQGRDPTAQEMLAVKQAAADAQARWAALGNK
jgi:hypothetical protein